MARGLLAAEGVVVFFLDTRILGTGGEVMTGFVRVRGGLPLRETSVGPESGNSGGARSGPRDVDTDSGWDSGEEMGVLTEGLIDSLFTGEIGVNGAFLRLLF